MVLYELLIIVISFLFYFSFCILEILYVTKLNYLILYLVNIFYLII